MFRSIEPADFECLKSRYQLDQLYFIASFQDPDTLIVQYFFGLRTNSLPDLAALTEQLIDLGKNPDISANQIVFLTSARQEVTELLRLTIRPYAESHGGDIILESIDETKGIVLIFFDGMCSGCPSSLMTLQYGVDNMLKQYLPWIRRIEASNVFEEPDFGFYL